jgi:hypothetical protein
MPTVELTSRLENELISVSSSSTTNYADKRIGQTGVLVAE